MSLGWANAVAGIKEGMMVSLTILLNVDIFFHMRAIDVFQSGITQEETSERLKRKSSRKCKCVGGIWIVTGLGRIRCSCKVR